MGDVQSASIYRSQTAGAHVLVQRLAIGSVKDDPILQLFAQEGFEQGEDHVEDVGLVHNVDVLYSHRNTFLKHLGEYNGINGFMIRTCNQSTILLANGGVNCHVCWRERPSMSKMTTAPAT